MKKDEVIARNLLIGAEFDKFVIEEDPGSSKLR